MKHSVITALLLLPMGCGEDTESGESVVRVYAASSLTDAFQEIEGTFETAHPAMDVALTFAGSQVLRLQIEQGARADLFASADPNHMQALIDAGRLQEPVMFAHNELVVIVPLDNPAGIESFADLRRANRVVLGTENVPVGRYARRALERTYGPFGEGFEITVLGNVVSQENNARLVRAKVELGEADAAIVYRTDAVSSDQVRVIPIPAEMNVRAEYPMAVIEGSEHSESAEQWMAFVRSSQGQAVLARHGFLVE